MATSPAYVDAAERLAAAPLEEGGWLRALEAVGRATRSARAQIIAFDPRVVHVNLINDLALSDSELADAGFDDPGQNWRCAADSKPMTVIAERDYAAARVGLRTEAYDELCERVDIPHGMHTVLHDDGGLTIGLATLRTASDGMTSLEDQRTFGALAPVALSAIRMQRAVETSASLLTMRSLEALGAAVFLCDRFGHVVERSPATEAILMGPGLKLVGGRLRAIDGAIDRALAAAMLSGDPVMPAPRLALRIGERPEAVLVIDVYPLPRRDWMLGRTPETLIAVSRPHAADDPRGQLLQTLLGLTPAESEVAVRIAEGESRDEIAAARGGSPHTIRTQFRSIYDKAGVRREGELVALLNRLLRC